jgi:hypothetical protein
MDKILQEEVKKMTQFGVNIDRLEKLSLNLSDDLQRFKLQITSANKDCRELIIQESKRIHTVI